MESGVVLEGLLLPNLRCSSQKRPVIGTLFEFAGALFFCLVASWMLFPVWFTRVNIFHTFSELFCVFIALTAFVIIWYTYEQNTTVNLLVGVGFLVVACCDIFHVYYFFNHQPNPPQAFNLSTWYWLCGRLTEAVLIFAVTINALHLRIRKYYLLIGVVGFNLLMVLIISYSTILPLLVVEGQGFTGIKMALEFLIIFIFVITLVRLLPRIKDRDILTYRYIFLALLLSVPCELCFALIIGPPGFTNILGHLLKVVSYYCLFRGIVLSALTYPYLKLEKAGEYLERVLNNLPEAILTYDRKSTLTFANQRAGQILGCEPQELIGLSAQEIVTMFSRVELGEIGWNLESKHNLIEITNRQGERIKLKMDTENLQDDGLICRLDEAKLEQEIINLHLQTQTILNSINNLVVMMDIHHRVVMCNTLWEEKVEMPSGLMVGLNIERLNSLLQFSDPDIAYQTLRGRKLSREVSLTTFAGKRLELRCDSAPILNVDGEIIGAIFICFDITEMRKQQTISQQQEKLAVLGEMAAGIVHEIRNPLTTVKGFMQLISARTEDEICREYADLVRTEVDEVNQVVSDFLTFARPRKPSLKETSLNQLIRSISSFWKGQLSLQGILLEVSLMDEEKPVMIDPGQIRQVLMNMVKNAIDALTTAENPRISLIVGYDIYTQRMTVTVADNGVGMDEEGLSKLGTPFYTTKDRGTGLGMGICYQIVKEHDGIIMVESEPGKGTTITISLPAA
jgi:PAS domain S-box-containing protein